MGKISDKVKVDIRLKTDRFKMTLNDYNKALRPKQQLLLFVSDQEEKNSNI